MDLNDFDTGSDEGGVLHVLHPATGLPLTYGEDMEPVTIHLLSTDHPKVRHFQRRLIAQVSKEGRELSPEEAESHAIEIMVAATLGWKGIGIGESETPFTPEKAREAYSRFNWLRVQVDNYASNLGNFIKASRKT